MRLIDADALIKTLGIGDMPIRLTYEIINAPTVDAVPVIRCKDCQLYYPIENHKHGHCAMYNFTHTDEDDYCSSAERKEE